MGKDETIQKRRESRLSTMLWSVGLVMPPVTLLLLLGFRVMDLAMVTVFLLFFLLLLMPFLPGIMEFRRPKDAEPLFIDMVRFKDPLYFGHSFRAMVRSKVETGPLQPGARDVDLSKHERVVVSEEQLIPEGRRFESVIYFNQGLETSRRVEFEKEVYVKESASLGEDNNLRALYCEGDVVLGRGSRVTRWVEADGEITILPDCQLGKSVATEAPLRVGVGCEFLTLYGLPLVTFETVPREFRGDPADYPRRELVDNRLAWKLVDRHLSINIDPPKSEDEEDGTLPSRPHPVDTQAEDNPEKPFRVGRNDIVIEAGSRVHRHFVARLDLEVKPDAVILGSVKAYGEVNIGDRCVVHGNIFAEGDIRIGRDVTILGNVFSQRGVDVAAGARIGVPDEIRSLIGKRRVRLAAGVTLFGYVLTEGGGVIG